MKNQTAKNKKMFLIKNSRFRHYVAKSAILFQIIILSAGCFKPQVENPVPPLNPNFSAGWANYPYDLVPGDPRLIFPRAEGRQLDMDSDTWFLEGVLEGQDSGRQFAFVALFIINRVGGFLPFDFYSLAFYDLDTGDYGTYTSFDGEVQASTGYLDLAFSLPGQDATWTTSIDSEGYLVPFSYHANLPGVDHKGRAMSLITDVNVQHPPVPVGADVFNGIVTMFGQANTYSYLQTGIQFNGTLTWGSYTEAVTGSLGHIDRQMFPLYAGVVSGIDGRDRSHEWRTFFLDNGMDFSSWRQYDRMAKNAEVPFNGATTYHPVDGTAYVGDIEYEILSYLRVENHAVQPLLNPRSNILYYPNRHRIHSASLGLDLLSEPIVHAPLLSLPVEYMHGPVLLDGTLEGQPIQGMGSFERTLALYRDFEFVAVLSDSVTHLPNEAFLLNTVNDVLPLISQVGSLVDAADSTGASTLANGLLRTELNKLVEPYRSDMLQILNDLIAVLSG